MNVIQPLRHDEFTLKRSINASRKLCYRAWTELEHKKNWFIGPEGWEQIERSVDFRVGGEEILHGRTDSFESKYTARFHLIIPDTQLIYAFDMHVNGGHYSISLTGLDFEESDNGTQITYVEKIYYLTEDYDNKGRIEGTNKLLDNYINYLDASNSN